MVDTKLDRVDLVEEGSCSEAYIMMYKGKDGALQVSKEKVEAILAKMKPEYREVIETYYEGEVEKAKCKKSEDGCEDNEEEEENEELDKAKADLATANEELAKTKEALDAANEELAKAKSELEEQVKKSKANEEPDFEEVLKAAPEAMRGFLTNLKKHNDELVAKAKQAEEEKLQAEAVAKAKELSVLPVEEAEIVSLYKSKEGKTVLPILEKIAKSIEQTGLFDEKGTGSNYNNNDEMVTIDQQIESVAKSKNISKEKAMIELFKEKPELYEKYNGGNK